MKKSRSFLILLAFVCLLMADLVMSIASAATPFRQVATVADMIAIAPPAGSLRTNQMPGIVLVTTGNGAGLWYSAANVTSTNTTTKLASTGLSGWSWTAVNPRASAALNFPSMATLTSADLTITVTGASTGDTVSLGLPAAPTAGISFSAFVSAADTVTVRAFNVSGGTIDPASATYVVSVNRQNP